MYNTYIYIYYVYTHMCVYIYMLYINNIYNYICISSCIIIRSSIHVIINMTDMCIYRTVSRSCPFRAVLRQRAGGAQTYWLLDLRWYRWVYTCERQILYTCKTHTRYTSPRLQSCPYICKHTHKAHQNNTHINTHTEASTQTSTDANICSQQ